MTRPEKKIDGDGLMLSAKQAADVLEIALPTLYGLANRGELRKRKVGKRAMFDRAEVERYIPSRVTLLSERQAARLMGNCGADAPSHGC